MTTLQFLGAAGAVTGSKFLLTTPHARLLVDCGLFQGTPDLKALNWNGLPLRASDLDAVLLTHAHLDHSGYLARLVAKGFHGPAYCTPGTADLIAVLLPDSGYLAEEEASHANRHGWSRHKPAEPLFTAEQAREALKVLKRVPYGEPREVAPGVTATFHPAGHILGSAMIELAVSEGGQVTTIVFTGDLGRPKQPLLVDPTPMTRADYLVVESTYGDRPHATEPPAQALARVVKEAVARGGMLLLPAFAVGRTQELLYVLRELEDQGAIPQLDIFMDSPMALDATAITLAHPEDFDAETLKLIAEGTRPLNPHRLHLVREVEQSKALNTLRGPGIIISASGMCTGGRIKHHLMQRLPDARNTVCLVGFQAAGTKGRALEDGARSVWIYGEQIAVRAQIERIEGFSAHADANDMLAWLKGFTRPPQRVFVVHGEAQASQVLAERIERELHWATTRPALGDVVELAPPGSDKDVDELLDFPITR